MKKLILSLLIIPLIGCSTFTYPNPIIDGGVTLGVSELLARGITNATTRTQVANYLNVAAAALRSLSTPQTPDQLVALISAYIPASVRTQYPEIMSAVTSLIVPVYQAAYTKYSGNLSKLMAATAQIATDLEAGSAPYISH